MAKILDELKKRILVIDGAMGTFLQKAGMPTGVAPEYWAINHPEILKNIHLDYINAGADIIITCTFGANRLKLSEFGFQNKVEEINHKAFEIAKNAACGQNVFVAGGLGPIGKFIEPFGDLKINDAIEIFKQQIKVFIQNNVDLLLIETLSDIQEARAFVLAAKELTDKIPIAVSLTYDENQRTLNGTDPLTALFTLQELDVDIISTNCSTGPAEMIKVIEKQSKYSTKYLMAEPNAGLPVIKDGKTYFCLSAEEFVSYVPEFIKFGINIIGGCCGTTPDFIKLIKGKVCKEKNFQPHKKDYTSFTSVTKSLFLRENSKTIIIGEKINPTGKPVLTEQLKNNVFNEVRKFAIEQSEAGADLLDINVGVPNADENLLMLKTIENILSISNLPLCIDSSNIKVIENALKFYPGIALINSINFEEARYIRLLELVKKYGANFIFLPISGKKLTKTFEERKELINKFLKILDDYKIDKTKMIVDGLVLTVSSNTAYPLETLKTIKYCSEKGLNTVIGLSNISFGLPERELLNATFLTLAIFNGLNAVILNPTSSVMQKNIKAVNALLNKDENCREYINYFTGIKEIEKKVSAEEKIEERIKEAVINGDKENIITLLIEAQRKEINAFDIVNNLLIPAITKVGELYEQKIYFLPQLIRAAETTEIGFKFLKKDLEKVTKKKCGTIILATVKGDIHDIGKNIVALMFRNFGFEVIDLGKDVDGEKIIETAIEVNADIIGLSALMTTTMIEMPKIIELKNRYNCKSKVIIGGAVTTQNFADEIQADGWSRDAIAAVKLVKRLLNIKEN